MLGYYELLLLFYSELTVFHIPNHLGDSKGNCGVTYYQNNSVVYQKYMYNSYWYNVKFSFHFARKCKEIWKENQKFIGSYFRGFFHTLLQKCFKDFKIGSKVRENLNGLVTICHPFSYWDLEMIKVPML